MNKNLALINEIIKASVSHGGDFGGPYYSDKESVINAMENYMKTSVIDNNVYIKTIDDIPQFCQRDTIYNDQNKNDGKGIYIYTDGNMVYIDSSEECGYAGNYAEISKEDFRVLFADEFAELKAEIENLKKLLSISKGDYNYENIRIN